MPRKWRVDGDEDRLPEGVTRTGYDADTQTYTYSGVNGEEYTGQPGQRYGELTLTRAASSAKLSQSPRPLSQLFAQPQADPFCATTESRVPSRSRTLAEPRQRLAVADHSHSHGERAAKTTRSSTRSSSTRSSPTRSSPTRSLSQATTTASTTPTSARASRRSHNPDRHQTLDAVMTPATTPGLTETTHLSPTPNRKNQTFSAILSPYGPTPTTPDTAYPRRMSNVPARRQASQPHRRRHSQPVPPPQVGVAREFCREAGGYLREVTVLLVQKMTRGLKKRREALRVERERRENEEAGWV